MKEPKILYIQVDWRDHVQNDAELRVLLDRVAKREEFTFTKKGAFYYAELGDEVMFLAHTKETPEENEGGFGGSIFELSMDDGTRINLAGPWSSRAGVMNKEGFGPCLDVSLTDDPKVMKDGHTFCAGHITLRSIQQWIREHEEEIDWKLKPEIDKMGELVWIPERLVEPCVWVKDSCGYYCQTHDQQCTIPVTNHKGKKHSCPECEKVK